jgi:hypothetical protein
MGTYYSEREKGWHKGFKAGFNTGVILMAIGWVAHVIYLVLP